MLALSERLTEATQAAQVLILVVYIDADQDNTVFFIWTSGNPSLGFCMCCNGVF